MTPGLRRPMGQTFCSCVRDCDIAWLLLCHGHIILDSDFSMSLLLIRSSCDCLTHLENASAWPLLRALNHSHPGLLPSKGKYSQLFDIRPNSRSLLRVCAQISAGVWGTFSSIFPIGGVLCGQWISASLGLLPALSLLGQ